ncbi:MULTISPECIES: DegV family protein [unclassified Clostridium]|uniref:DegV family protein n=1 Tax=unclassified Clostridium TaxID=2614128 RepID=UPI00189B332F|nr:MULTISPECIES: DegV family protein [unclassified Clostridium]MCR1951126.1 DegV family protein [Clostridium sp. DSM 100503]
MIKIVSDSSTLYSIEEGQANNIDIAPLSVSINNKTYREYEDINTKEFIDIINEGHIPKSSQPSIGHVLDLYSKYPEDEIINISMADGLSGTYNSAFMARNMDNNPERIDVINSKTLCGPHRYLVDLAVKLVEAGYTRSEIVNELNKFIETSTSFLIPHDFDFLVRGGRVSSIVGKIGSAIKLVPVMTLSEDCKSLEKFTTKRTYKKAVKKITEVFLEKNIDFNYKIYISHACKEDLANETKEIILEDIKDADIEIKLLSPAFTTQGGPGCVAIQVIKKHDLLK